VGDVFRMSSIHVAFVAFEEWVSVHVHESVIISGRDELLIIRHGARVDVRAITTCREYALDAPSELGGLRCPHCFNGVRGA